MNAVAGAIKPLLRWSLKDHECNLVGQRLADSDSMEGAGRWMFEDAMEGGELTDMEFVLDSGRRIRGHKVWLMGRSEYMRAMLSCGMQEGRTGFVCVRECGQGAFLALLEFIYTGRLGKSCLGQDWQELWDLADLFGIEDMQIGLLGAVSQNNVDETARLAVDKGNRQLMERCVGALPSKLTVENFELKSEDNARRVVRAVDILSECGDDDDWGS